MTELRQIPDQIYGEAGAILRAVAGVGPRPEVEAMTGFEAMVAGTAIALEKGAPHAMYDSRVTTAEEWLKDGSDPWRKLHTATARVIDLHRTKEVLFDGPESVMTHIAADVVNQSRAQRMETALRFNDKPFDDALTPDQLEDVKYARDHPRYAQDIRHESYGNYSELGTAARRSLANVMETGENLGPDFRRHLAPAVAVVARDLNDLPYRNREVDERLAEFSDKVETGTGRDLFKAARSEDLRRVDQLREGAEPIGNVEVGIVAHMLVHEKGVREEVSNGAYARALSEQEGRSITAPQVAVRLEAERIAVENARSRVFAEIDDVNGVPDHVDQIAFGRRFETIEPEVQAGLFQQIEYGENVPALKAMRLGQAALAIENGELKMDRDRGFTYENTTAEAASAYRLDGLYLPGDKVRMDDKVNVRGVDKEALRATLGTEPLEIARTVIVGSEHDNGMGGTSPAVRPEYEFVGRKERYPAGQFQHERGDEHVYAMIAVVNDRMFLVPLDDKADQQSPVVTGPPREIRATLVSDDKNRNDENVEIMRHEVSQAPVAGEFVFRPDAFGRKEGPIELVAVPWMGGVGGAEHDVGMKAIQAEIAKGAPDAGRQVDAPSALNPNAGARTAAFAASQAAHSRA